LKLQHKTNEVMHWISAKGSSHDKEKGAQCAQNRADSEQKYVRA
jgi:hypothetical protein